MYTRIFHFFNPKKVREKVRPVFQKFIIKREGEAFRRYEVSLLQYYLY